MNHWRLAFALLQERHSLSRRPVPSIMAAVNISNRCSFMRDSAWFILDHSLRSIFDCLFRVSRSGRRWNTLPRSRTCRKFPGATHGKSFRALSEQPDKCEAQMGHCGTGGHFGPLQRSLPIRGLSFFTILVNCPTDSPKGTPFLLPSWSVPRQVSEYSIPAYPMGPQICSVTSPLSISLTYSLLISRCSACQGLA